MNSPKDKNPDPDDILRKMLNTPPKPNNGKKKKDKKETGKVR
tara:strand:+ start:65824 stop:65949 length:126 start_codon:yes stop_codon:yes gene_type:complete